MLHIEYTNKVSFPVIAKTASQLAASTCISLKRTQREQTGTASSF